MKDLVKFLFDKGIIPVLAVTGLFTWSFIFMAMSQQLNYIPKLFAQWIILPFIFGH